MIEKPSNKNLESYTNKLLETLSALGTLKLELQEKERQLQEAVHSSPTPTEIYELQQLPFKIQEVETDIQAVKMQLKSLHNPL